VVRNNGQGMPAYAYVQDAGSEEQSRILSIGTTAVNNRCVGKVRP